MPAEKITSKIYYVNNEKVMLDFDVAELYGVETRVLKQSVKRNINRFPKDFMFQLTKSDWNELITICDNLGSRKFSPVPPFAFTEQGVAMLSSVLKSKRAVKVNIAIMRAFVELRKFLHSTETLAKKLTTLEKETNQKFEEQQKQITLIFEAIKQLIKEEKKDRTPIGFTLPKKK
ncbi:MAG: ORF6N domain-containing protein [Ignavibacteria bacterium]